MTTDPQTAADAAERVQAFLDAWDGRPGGARPDRVAYAMNVQGAMAEPQDWLLASDLRTLLADYARMATERDEARELACTSLDILRNVSDEPMRELFGVDDMDEMPSWFTRYGGTA